MLNVSQRPRYLRTDLHLHSTFSDGRPTVAQLVERAKGIGFVFAISDHYSSLMPMKDDAALGVYLDELEKYPVYRAVEVDLGEQLPMSDENRARLDYLIGSVHNVVTEEGERLPFDPARRDGEPEGGLDRYMDLYIAAVRRDVLAGTVHMIGHPTFLPGLRSRGLHDELWTPERRRSFLEAVVQSGVALEISTRYKVPTPVLMREALEAGVRFAVGSDSHWLDRAADISLPLRYVEEFKIPEDRFFLPERVIEPPAVIV